MLAVPRKKHFLDAYSTTTAMSDTYFFSSWKKEEEKGSLLSQSSAAATSKCIQDSLSKYFQVVCLSPSTDSPTQTLAAAADNGFPAVNGGQAIKKTTL